MELGQKLRQARQEAGFSQRQLCGEEITRNMLSQIENGSARPSMDTLRFLAQRLGKPISYFLDERAVVSPNQAVMTQARAAFAQQAYGDVLAHLAQYQSPDPVFDWEQQLLDALSRMAMAEQAISDGKLPYAEALLEQIGQPETPYFTQSLQRQRQILVGISSGHPVSLPPDDRPLLLRAKAALEQGNSHRAAQYLDAAENQKSPEWNLLRGRSYMALSNYEDALTCLEIAQEQFPKDSLPLLEQCCRELEDYKGAYFYACKCRDFGR
jgi:transcriptional regulator with XRE-family HTH domain